MMIFIIPIISKPFFDKLKSSDYKIAYSKCLRTTINHESGKIIKKDVPFDQSFDTDKLKYDNYIPITCVMHYKSCFEEVGYFKEDLDVLMDWDFLVRLSENYDFSFVDNITCEIFRRTDSTNLSSNVHLIEETSKRLRLKYLNKSIESHRRMTNILGIMVNIKK